MFNATINSQSQDIKKVDLVVTLLLLRELDLWVLFVEVGMELL
jgi:hypothetical protein